MKGETLDEHEETQKNSRGAASSSKDRSQHHHQPCGPPFGEPSGRADSEMIGSEGVLLAVDFSVELKIVISEDEVAFL